MSKGGSQAFIHRSTRLRPRWPSIAAYPLGRRLLAAILLCSTVLALMATGVQLFLDFRRDVDSIDARIAAIESSYLDSLAISVWNYDRTTIHSQLEGIARLPDIASVQLVDDFDRVLETAGGPMRDDAPIRRTMPLWLTGAVGRSEPVQVGTLTVTASLEGVYQSLRDRVVVILVTQTIKTFVIAILILLMFQRMVSRPLTRLADYARTLNVSHLDKPLVLRRRPRRGQPDEFDLVVSAFNDMRASIRRDVDAINAMRAHLSRSEERYRRLVESTHVVPWEADAESWQFGFIGPQADGLLGFPLADWYRADFWNQHLDPDDAQRLAAACRTADGAFECEVRLRNAQGESRWLWVQAVERPAGSEHGRLFQGYLLDIDTRKRAEAELASYRQGLEALVEQRTGELEEQVQRLRETQHQLLLAEKMASIGQLAAGVAHEINNPIGFVASNMETMQRYAADLLGVLEAYRRCEPLLPAEASEVTALATRKHRADIDFLVEDIPNLLRESAGGLARVTRIVRDLRHFSHADQTESWERVDVHRGLESTINIVWNELKYKAEVIKDFGEIPPVVCIPAQVNQVFMNLLVNAGQAIKERGVIRIVTRTDGEGVLIHVSDTGEGIAPENLKRIFNPFFTTKPVGEGTGLGLSLAYGIVERHGGRIEVTSQPGEGTTFTVWLPIEQPHHAVATGRRDG